MGRPRTSPLAPVLRSDAVGRILAAVVLSSEPLHLRAISERTEVAYSVVQREIDKLERSQLVRSTRFATSRSVRANENHPLFRELRALLLKAYGPREVVAELLAAEPGVQQAYIHGSWAARYSGEWGEPPADLDVLIVGDVRPARREELEAEAEDGLGQPVHIEVVEPDEWRAATSAFLRTVKQRPLIPVGSGKS